MVQAFAIVRVSIEPEDVAHLKVLQFDGKQKGAFQKRWCLWEGYTYTLYNWGFFRRKV